MNRSGVGSPSRALASGAALGAGIGLAGWGLAVFTVMPELLSILGCLSFVLIGAFACGAARLVFGRVTGAAIGMILGGVAGTLLASAELGSKAMTGRPAELSGVTLEGKPFDIASLHGKVVVVDFWATWCGPCVAEMPELKKLYEEKRGEGLEVVGVSLDRRRSALTRFVEVNEIEWPQLFDPDQDRGGTNPVALRYGVQAIPHTLLIDREGKIVATGLRGGELKRAVNKVLSGGKVSHASATIALAIFGALIGAMLHSGRMTGARSA